jgi:hypothetical protein
MAGRAERDAAKAEASRSHLALFDILTRRHPEPSRLKQVVARHNSEHGVILAGD